jgi:1-pyrroline-5-carboxylate dehydrogenase
MPKGIYNVPKAVNEVVKSYAPGSPEREQILKTYKELYNSTVDVPLFIGEEEIKTGDTKRLFPPFDHQHTLGQYHQADKALVEKAIASALEARKKWATMPWETQSCYLLKSCRIIGGSIPC